MLFNSIDFLLFFPVVVCIHFLLPKKVRHLWLLLASYVFYMSWGKKQGLLLLGVTILTYVSGLFLDRLRRAGLPPEREKRLGKICLGATLIINLGFLCYFKYLNLVIGIWNDLSSAFQAGRPVSVVEIVLPVGISFYIFQALGYVIDVYRGEICAEKDFFRYALFVSFFPQLVAGPIERSKNLFAQIRSPKNFSFENLQRGFVLMLWGLFMKMVIADRAAIIVNRVYGDSVTYNGLYIVIATLLFAIQIYCDFGGYSTIARGAALVLGFRLTDNFNAPYFSKTVKEFWRRWHISLTGWFRDYLYIPLGGNRKGEVRKQCNLLFVFSVSGLWHGAAISYVIWGLLNGLYQVAGDLSRKLCKKIASLLPGGAHKGEAALRESEFGKNLLKRVSTFLLIGFSWLFFRAGNCNAAFALIRDMLHFNWEILFDGSLYLLGVEEALFRVFCYAVLLLFAVDYIKYRGIDVLEKFMALSWWVRLGAESILLFGCFLYGCYGEMYDATQFIYFQF